MELFESMLILVAIAIVLLQVARHLGIPYPTILALAGVLVAALPWAPRVVIDARLALALFIAPALLSAAYDLPLRELRRHWRPLIALAGVAVVLTTAAVAWAGYAIAGLPIAAAVALGAIVAPPDAAAAAATLGRLDLPRRTISVLRGESLLNDAVALLIFSAAVGMAAAPAAAVSLLPKLALAIPGGLFVGVLVGKTYVRVAPRLAGTLGGTLLEFAATFGAWVLAERFAFSAILSVVAFGMTVARHAPERQSPRDRLHSFSVWEATVFLLNVLAFLLMGLQAREIVTRLDASELRRDLEFAGIVVLIVILVRLAWVLLYNRLVHHVDAVRGNAPRPSISQGIVVAWAGMRGLVTLATALALPASFPGRDLIVLSALAVVLGTLVVQGLTLGPLIGMLRLKPDTSFDRELSTARVALLNSAIADLEARDGEPADRLRADYRAALAVASDGLHPRAVMEIDKLRRRSIIAQRRTLADLRGEGVIDDDVFRALEQELDWVELAVSPPDRFELVEG